MNMSYFNKLTKSCDMALALYDKQADMRCQHYSFIWFKDRIISIGRNCKKTHPHNLLNPRIGITGVDVSSIKGTCSELNAIMKLKNLTNIKTNKCILINVRVDNNRRFNMAKPCQSCQSLLKYHQFKEVYYTNNIGGINKYEI